MVPAKNRMLFADLLRISAIFGAIMVHVSAGMMNEISMKSLAFFSFNIYDSTVRFCVPVYVMLSGMLFLNPAREILTKNIYIKYIRRILLALLFYGTAYYVLLARLETGVWDLKFIVDGLVSVLKGDARYHLWYLYMLIGLYIITPFLRIYTAGAQKKEIEYFLLLFLLFTGVFYPMGKFPAFENVARLLDQMKVSFIFGYTGYYLLGYYLYKYTFSQRATRIIYLLGGLSLFFTIGATYLLSIRQDEPVITFYSYFSLNVILMSAAIFLLFKNYWRKRTIAPAVHKLVSKIAGCSFTMYLVHDFFLIAFSEMNLTTLSFLPVISPLVLALLTFVLSFILAYLLNNIARLGKNLIKALRERLSSSKRYIK